MGRHDWARPQGCPALAFCLKTAEKKWVNHHPAVAMGFRIEPPKTVSSASSGSPVAVGGAACWLLLPAPTDADGYCWGAKICLPPMH